ncbi:MAG: dihydroneopterin aldolase [Hyphomicrobiaceae bacterium]
MTSTNVTSNPRYEFDPGQADRIVIRGLQVEAFVGIHDYERERRQGVRFDVDIQTVADYADIVNETGRYVSYGDTVKYIRERAASDEHVELVETWAEDVSRFVLQNDLVTAVRVSVLKTDIFSEAEGVGVEIVRTRESNV